MIMLVDASCCTLPFAQLVEVLKKEGEQLGVDIRAQREEIFHAMHRI